MSPWETFGDESFADVVTNIKAALDGAHEDDLKAKRRQGLQAYERAMAGRHFRPGQIRASFLDVMRLDDDDLGED